MNDTIDLIGRYIAAWNETNAERRRSLIARTFADAASYVDPMMESHGHAELDAMISGVQERFPALRFRLAGAVDTHHGSVRFSWELTPDTGEPVAKGTDFAVLAEDGRLLSVTGFLDAVAAQ
jgi:SnoaL-like domain